jgi:hypothetical protein
MYEFEIVLYDLLQVLTVRMARMMYSSDTTDIRKTPQKKQKTPYYKRDVVGIGAKKQVSE